MPRFRAFALALVLAVSVTALPAGAVLEPLDPVFDAVAGDACDPIDPELCLLPFPNDHFTVADEDTETGLRVDIHPLATPRVLQGAKPILTDELNRNDGFSPGSMVVTFVPGLDLHQTWGTAEVEPVEHRDHIADIARYAAADAPMLIVNAETGERHPFWSELDMHADTGDDERLLILRPAVNFDESTRYLVALRDLRDADGEPIPAGDAFRAYLAGDGGDADRQADITRIVDELEAAETGRGNDFDADELHLAWEFTVASWQSIAGRALHIRDDAFAQLGDTDLGDGVVEGDSPAVSIDRVEPDGDETYVHGSVTTPNYLTHHISTGDITDPTGQLTDERLSPVYVPQSRFFYLPGDDLPSQNPLQSEVEVPFTCRVPAGASAEDPARLVLMGHGLLGERFEVGWSSGNALARNHNTMYCATEWLGMAFGDLPNVALILADPSLFASLADRAQQGFLQFMFLGRAMLHPDGLASLDEFRDGDAPLIDTSELHYEGNSQGGIMGGALTALAPDFTKSVLGVPGMNYSTLLNRNHGGWEGDDPLAYGNVYYYSTPGAMQRQLGFALLQMLWDRAEANGYAHHMTDDPYPNTPAKQVVLHVAHGDFQVANVAAEVQARTIGARLLHTSLASLRHWSVDPLFGLEPFDVDGDGNVEPWAGSALVYWDSGNLVPPNANIPPALVGGDSHGDPRSAPGSDLQRVRFFDTGDVIDVHPGSTYCTRSAPRAGEDFVGPWCPTPDL